MRAAIHKKPLTAGFLPTGWRSFFSRCNAHPLLTTAIIVTTIKLTLFAADPTPLFFMGDSRTFIDSAIGGYIPADRSFTYGIVIRWLAVCFGTLHTLVIAQVLAGAATAWLLALLLLRFFGARPVIAVAASVVFAVDPLQIVHERLVLTETVTLFFLAINLLLALWYLSQPRLFKLLAVCLTGISIVSLRFVYIPVTVAAALLLPLLGWKKQAMRTCLLHVAAGIIATLGLHIGYRHLVGALSDLPPAYQYRDGLFLASAWAPLLRPEDATEARVRSVIARQIEDPRLPLQNRHLREAQLWSSGGFVDRLRGAFSGDRNAANRSAKALCLSILRRDPLDVARLAWRTYLDYQRTAIGLRTRLFVEQGSDRPLPQDFIQELLSIFALNAADSHATMTLSKRLHWPVEHGTIFCFLRR